MCVAAAIISPAFLNPFNIINVLRQIALFGIVSVGMTFVILTAGIDLSVGSIVAVAAVVSAMLLDAGTPIPLVLLAGLADRRRHGRAQRARHHARRHPALHHDARHDGDGARPRHDHLRRPSRSISARRRRASPGSARAISSACRCRCGSSPRSPAAAYLRAPPHAFGRNVYAVGSNPEAARLSGIDVGRTIFSVYAISGFLSALTALIFVSRLTVGEPVAGVGLELEAIAITVIGGTSLFGGEGSVVGTIIGAAIIAVLANILNLFGVSPFTQQIVKGAIIVAAVLFEMQRRRRSNSASLSARTTGRDARAIGRETMKTDMKTCMAIAAASALVAGASGRRSPTTRSRSASRRGRWKAPGASTWSRATRNTPRRTCPTST